MDGASILSVQMVGIIQESEIKNARKVDEEYSRNKFKGYSYVVFLIANKEWSIYLHNEAKTECYLLIKKVNGRFCKEKLKPRTFASLTSVAKWMSRMGVNNFVVRLEPTIYESFKQRKSRNLSQR